MDALLHLTVTEVIAANRLLKAPAGAMTQRNSREKWAIMLKLEGKTVYNQNGKEFLSDCRNLVILPKGCSYSWRCVEPGECLVIDFDADGSGDGILPFFLSDSDPVINAFTKMEKTLNASNKACRLECMQLLYGLLLFFARPQEREYVTKQKQQIIQEAVSYITQNYFDSGITNELLAKRCGISTVYFRKTFEKVYGVPPIRYLHHYRMEKAKSILRSDYESIQQVAESVGYNSICHFSKMFKLYTGRNPSEYAKASRE